MKRPPPTPRAITTPRGVLEALQAARLFVFDMDGCLIRGKKALPSAIALTKRLRSRFLLKVMTNNATRTPRQYARQLRELGFAIPAGDVMTSAVATSLFLRQKYGPLKCMLIGERGIQRALEKQGHRLFPASLRWSGKVDAVVVGQDRGFTYRKLLAAQQAILRGALFIATNRDLTFPVEGGFYPGGGCLVACLEAASRVKATVIGKPAVHMLRLIETQTGVPPKEAVMVGDRLETDILAGKRVGWLTVLVETGVHAREDIRGKAPRPDLIVRDLGELGRLLKPATARR